MTVTRDQNTLSTWPWGRLDDILRHWTLHAAAVIVVACGVLAASGGVTRLMAQDGDADGSPSSIPPKGSAWAGVLFLYEENARSPYLVAESIDPNSPANKAGLLPGDSIISFNGVGIRSVITNPKRFKPGDKVTVKFRRNGVKELPLILGVRPDRWLKHPATNMAFKVSVNDLLAAADVLPPFAGGGTGCTDLPIAGAEVMQLNADLAAALNARKGSGLLVLNVAPGTPATKAGIKSGDVLLSADSASLDTPLALAKAMRASKAREVTLTVQRTGETRTVKLQW